MSTNPPVPGTAPAPAPAPSPDNTQQLITFLRQESQASRDALREDSTANREMLLGAIRIVAIPVAAAIVFLGLFGFKSFSDLKNQLQDSATQQVNSEALKMQEEIRSRLDDQFKTPIIQGLVKDAARDATEKSAKPLIEAEVRKEVQAHIEAEAPQIHAAVINETKLGVTQMKPQIDSEISKQAADAKADIEAQIAPYGALVNAGTLAEMAQNGSGTAFDALMKMSGSSDPRIIELVSTTHNAVFLEFESDNGIYMTRQFTVTKSHNELIELLSSPQPLDRQAAIDGLASSRELVPRFLDMMRHDPFIFVRRAAHHALTQSTGQHFNALDDVSWDSWWAQNRANWK